MSRTVRAFVAVELAQEALETLVRVQEAIAGDGLNIRWVRRENIHLTLKFLGEVPVDRVDAVAGAMGEAARHCPAMVVTVQGLGVFPGMNRPRILWAGLHGDTRALGALHRRLDQALARCGFEPEKRPFKAHLTLGRFRDRVHAKSLAKALTRAESYGPVACDVGCMTLFKSRLTPGGAVYTRLSQTALARG